MIRNELPEILYESINMVEPYPMLVKPVVKMIDITAFFPGGRGLWLEESSDKLPSILVLGQDFSTVVEYNKMVINESADLASATWRNLIALFEEANIDLKDCFFSNVFMGLRDTVKMTGEFPGFKDKDFVKRNVAFLSYQIDLIRPQVIITLGKYAAEMLTYLSNYDLDRWKKWNALRVPNVGFNSNVRFKDHVCACIALEHTSMRNSNVNRRVYIKQNVEYCGNGAEVEMLRDAKKVIQGLKDGTLCHSMS